MADETDISGLLLDPGDDKATTARAIAAALRKQKQVGNALIFAAHPDQLGASVTQDAEKQQGDLGQALKERLGFAIQGKGLDRQIAQMQLEQANKNRQYEMEKQKLGMESFRLQHPEANKPGPEQVMLKLNNEISSMADIDALEDAHAEVGLSAVTALVGPGTGSQGRYGDAIKAHGASVAAASLPLGRETPESVRDEVEKMPTGFVGKERSHQYWNDKRAAILGNAEAQLRSLEAGGYSPQQLSEMRGRLNAAKKKMGSAPATSEQLTAETKTINGKRYGKINGKWHEL